MYLGIPSLEPCQSNRRHHNISQKSTNEWRNISVMASQIISKQIICLTLIQAINKGDCKLYTTGFCGGNAPVIVGFLTLLRKAFNGMTHHEMILGLILFNDILIKRS